MDGHATTVMKIFFLILLSLAFLFALIAAILSAVLTSVLFSTLPKATAQRVFNLLNTLARSPFYWDKKFSVDDKTHARILYTFLAEANAGGLEDTTNSEESTIELSSRSPHGSYGFRNHLASFTHLSCPYCNGHVTVELAKSTPYLGSPQENGSAKETGDGPAS